MTFTLAIIGRPNVGKSTLFNRLTGKPHALVHDAPGVTRDRREGAGRIADLAFSVMDTAGIDAAEKGSLQSRMTAQTMRASQDADVILMMVDGRTGITPVDEEFAKLLRKSKKPLLLVVNKAEGKAARATILDAHRLGLGDPIAISAEHGEGMGDLYDALQPFAGDAPVEEIPPEEGGPLTIAIVGRPNVGKSTLLNAILGEERVLTGPEAGITRDSITVAYSHEGKDMRLVDTAGMRKKANVNEKLEKMSVADTLRAVQYAQVVVVVMDAEQPLEKQDNAIAALVESEGRAMVIAINKWDTVKEKDAFIKAFRQRFEKVLPQIKGVPVVPISGEKNYNIGKLFNACFEAYSIWNTRIGTGELNRWLEAMLEAHTPQLVSGRRLKIRYITQKSARPPSFVLFSNLKEVPENYLRYLVNGLRERFALQGVPIRIAVKKNKNPYADGDS
ncbi:MAG: ribosome biogenesis GTPase Der [Alphaproteobacteria bacterium]|nr:ribosome biogenesis GTPase Der [Alphaproteobacteria bacterium]